MATTFLEGRLQSAPQQEPGRTPDMEEAAAKAMHAALRVVGGAAARSAVGRGGASSHTNDCGELGGHDGSVAGSVGECNGSIAGVVNAEVGSSTVLLNPGGEVLLAAGALGSPQLLQLSGLGNPAVLEAAGVPVRRPMVAVGEGLQDHPAVTVAFDCSIPDGMSQIKPWMPYLNVISPIALCQWAFRGAGVLATTYCDHGAFVRSAPETGPPDSLPDVQLRFVPGIGPAADGVKAYELLGKGVQHGHSGFTLQVINCRPRSTGTVRIRSADPSVAPQIRCNYLNDPSDGKALARGIALARRLATAGALGDVSAAEVYPGAHVQSEEEVDAYIRSTLHSANGLSGGCCIGRVVDDELKVVGVRGLRVADASVMPKIPGAQLALPTAMIAERASKLIKAAAAARPRGCEDGGDEPPGVPRRRTQPRPRRPARSPARRGPK